MRKLALFAAPSGSGKTTIRRQLEEKTVSDSFLAYGLDHWQHEAMPTTFPFSKTGRWKKDLWEQTSSLIDIPEALISAATPSRRIVEQNPKRILIDGYIFYDSHWVDGVVGALERLLGPVDEWKLFWLRLEPDELCSRIAERYEEQRKDFDADVSKGDCEKRLDEYERKMQSSRHKSEEHSPTSIVHALEEYLDLCSADSQ